MSFAEYYKHIFTTSNGVTNAICCYSNTPTLVPENGFFTAIDDSTLNERVSIPVKDVILVRSIPVLKGEETKKPLTVEVKATELDLVKELINVLTENKDKMPDEVVEQIFEVVNKYE